MYDLCATSKPLALLATWSLISPCAAALVTCHTHRSFPLRQDGGAPAAAKPPPRTHIVRPQHALTLVETSSRYFALTLSLPISPNHPPAPACDSSPPLHPPPADSAIGQPEATGAMSPNVFVHNMVLLFFVLMVSAATTALDGNDPGCKSRIRYLVDAVPLTRLQLLSLIATSLSPTRLAATEQTELLTAPISLTSALR